MSVLFLNRCCCCCWIQKNEQYTQKKNNLNGKVIWYLAKCQINLVTTYWQSYVLISLKIQFLFRLWFADDVGKSLVRFNGNPIFQIFPYLAHLNPSFSILHPVNFDLVGVNLASPYKKQWKTLSESILNSLPYQSFHICFYTLRLQTLYIYDLAGATYIHFFSEMDFSIPQTWRNLISFLITISFAQFRA